MVDLHGQYNRIKLEIDHAIQDVLDSTAFIQGPEVQQFADALGKYVNTPFVIPCANGTDALQIAMMALNMRPGDEIVLPVHTYVATAEVIALLGLIPIFVDVDENTFNIDVNQIENKITAKTKAIVPVHLYGQCADMESLLAIATKHKLYIIEDAAQALGASFTFSNGEKKQAGTMGRVGTTSFFPSKNLGCFGDGGAVFTSDKGLAERIKMIANHGQKIKYHHETIGVNSRLDTLQAAILKVKLQYLSEYERTRNEVAKFYNANLANLRFIQIPHRVEYSSHVYHQYTIKVSQNRRDDFKQHLEKYGIPTMIYYPIPLHLQNAYRKPGFGPGSFPVAESLSKTVISLPIHTEIDETQLRYICEAIRNFNQ